MSNAQKAGNQASRQVSADRLDCPGYEVRAGWSRFQGDGERRLAFP
jgi:hypothetical protein